MPPPGSSTYFRGYGAGAYNYQVPQPSIFGLRPNEMTGVSGAAAQMLMPMLSEMFRTQFGGYGNTFGSDMNVESTVYARDHMMRLAAARAAAAKADEQGTEQIIRGMTSIFQLAPVDLARTRADQRGRVMFDAAGENMISTIGRDSAAMLQYLAPLAPDQIDRGMSAVGGSRVVAAQYMTNAGRYIRDPLTGRSVADDPEYINRVLNPLLVGDRQSIGGLRAGQVGALYEELSKGGMIGGPGPRTGSDAAGGVAGLLGSGTVMREGQEQRTRETLQRYSKTVAAIRDIFAENGQGDAPMSRLIQGLDALTQGGIANYDADRLTRAVRTYHGASQTFGIDMAALERMSGASSQLLQQQGGHRNLALDMPLQAAYAERAVNQSGLRNRVTSETVNQDELAQLVLTKQAAFAGSDFGNLTGAILYQGRYAAEGTDLRRAADALKAGSTTVTLADGNQLDLTRATQSDLVGLAGRSGISAGGFLGQIANARTQNQAALADLPGDALATIRGGAQGREYATFFQSRFGGELRGVGLDPAQALAFLRESELEGGTDSEIIERVGTRHKLTSGQKSVLGVAYGSIGEMYGAASGVQMTGGTAGLLNNPEFHRRMGASRTEAEEAAGRLSSTTHLARGGFLGNLGEGIVGAGRRDDAGGTFRMGVPPGGVPPGINIGPNGVPGVGMAGGVGGVGRIGVPPGGVPPGGVPPGINIGPNGVPGMGMVGGVGGILRIGDRQGVNIGPNGLDVQRPGVGVGDTLMRAFAGMVPQQAVDRARLPTPTGVGAVVGPAAVKMSGTLQIIGPDGQPAGRGLLNGEGAAGRGP